MLPGRSKRFASLRTSLTREMARRRFTEFAELKPGSGVMPAYGRTKPRRTMRREDYLTGAQAQVDRTIQAVATELLLRQDAGRQCLRNHRNRPGEFGVVRKQTVWRTGKDTDFRVLSGIDYR